MPKKNPHQRPAWRVHFSRLAAAHGAQKVDAAEHERLVHALDRDEARQLRAEAEEHRVSLAPLPAGWQVATGLPEVGKLEYAAADYDALTGVLS